MNFYKCPKCARTWRQPVEICPYCFAELEKIKTDQATVIGSSKVAISTILHPKAPYYLLLLQDNLSNKWICKSENEVILREEFKRDRSQGEVVAWRIKYDLAEAIEEVFIPSVGPESKILILPTVVSPTHSYLRENTSPEFLIATIDYLLSRGAKKDNIIVGAQSFGEGSIMPSAVKSGLLESCLDKGLKVVDLAEGPFIKKGNLEVSETVLQADLVINLAMMKMGQASASENIFKVLEKGNYSARIYLDSGKEVVDEIIKNIPHAFTLGEGDFVKRSDGSIVFLGIILSGSNPLKVDKVFNRIVRAKKEPELLKDIDLADIFLSGRSIMELEYEADK